MGQELDTQAEERILERLKNLPPQQLNEIIQFIDFITERQHGKSNVVKLDDIERSIRDLRGRPQKSQKS